MFEGDMKKGIPDESINAFAKSAKKQGAKRECKQYCKCSK